MASVGNEAFDPGTVGERSIESAGPEPPAQAAELEAQGVLLGAGGDPLILGLPTFIVGSFALAFVKLGVVPATGIGFIIPIIAFTTAIGQFLSALWAIFLGQSIVACILGVFGGFWAATAILLLGLDHNWFVVPAATLVHGQELYFISWAMLIFFLFIISLRLPAVYPVLLLFVILALVCVILSLEDPGSVNTWSHLAGICTFVFAGLGVWAWLNVGSIALGGPARPSLGPPIVK